MPPGKSPRRRVATCSLIAITLACALPLSARAGRPSDGDLSSRLAELAKPSLRSASPARQARELGVAKEGPGSLLREGNRVLVSVRFDRGAAAGVDDLRAAGVRVVDVSDRYQTVTVAAKPNELRRLARVPRVAGASEVLAPIVYGSEGPGPVSAAVTPCFGAATSEGDSQLRAAEAREMFGVDGSGVTVGILSDSFDQDSEAPTNVLEDVASGDLPGPANPCDREDGVVVLDDSETEGEDEGRAMAQIVHDLAPGAQLAFATAFKKTMFGFAENIVKLAEPVASGGAEADVLVDDVSYFEEPFFQEGPVGVAVREVSEAGVDYFSSAGNNNLRSGSKDFASWEAPEFRDASPTACPTGLPGYAQHCMDFDPGAGVDTDFGVTVSGEDTLNLDLQWAQPWDGVTTDLDVYLLNSANEVVTEGEDFNVTSTQRPFEFLSWTNPSAAPRTMRIAIDRCASSCDPVNGGDGGSPRLKFALLQNGGGVLSTEYETSTGEDVVGPTIFGHNGAEDAMSVGAIRFTTNAAPEAFSSRGPVTLYFEPVASPTPAEPLASPQLIAKPDVVATDGGADTFFGTCVSDVWRFFGTSASAPHAAAVAALELAAKPTASVAEMNDAQRESAATVGAFPPEAVGAGMLDAVGAIEQLGVTPSSAAAPESPPAAGPCFPAEPEPEPEPQPDPGPVGTPPTGQGPSGGQGDGPRPAPNTFFLLHPPKTIKTRRQAAKATFRFGASESGVTFLCRVDRGAFRECRPRFIRQYRIGSHVLRVKARGAAGATDSTPAVFRFRVKPFEGG